jgi:4-hydroxy-4-methyl-2-oxoglutarate aldolase
VRIESGDIVVGDRDGVVIVPLAEAASVAKKLAEVKAAEAGLEALVRGGLEVPDFVTAIIRSDRVEEIG